MRRSDPVVAVVLVLAVSLAAVAQATRKTAASSTRPGLTADPLTLMALPAPPKGVRPSKQPHATIDRVTLDSADFVRELAELYLPRAVDSLVQRKILELELAKKEIKLSDVDVEREAVRLLGIADPQSEWSTLSMTSPQIAADLLAQARDSLGWFRVNHPEGDGSEGDDQSQHILKQLNTRKTIDGYKVRKRYAGDALAVDIAADVTAPDGKIDAVLDTQVMDYLRATVRHDELAVAREGMIDDWLLGRELAAIGESVSTDEITKAVAAMNAKHKPPFDWKMICQFKNTTRERETAMFRRMAAWRKLTAFASKPEDLLAFAKEREDHYRGEGRQVTQVLFHTVDSLSGGPLDAGAVEQAAADAKATHEKLTKGADIAEFGRGRPPGAQGGWSGFAPTGPPQVTFKRFEGEQALVDAVFALTPENPLSKPVKGTKGWYVFKLEKVIAPNPKVGLEHFAESRYAEWITGDYERARLADYLAALRRKSDVKPGSETTLTSGW